MSPSTRLRLSYACTFTAAVLVIAGLAGMMMEPRPGWQRNLWVPALALIIAGRLLRRSARAS